MKIYKVPKRQNPEDGCGDEHLGYFYTSSKKEASRTFKKEGADPDVGDQIEVFEVPLKKESVFSFLNNHCSHPDNG